MKAFMKDIEQWALEVMSEQTSNSFVTEAGDIEDWKGNSTDKNKQLLDDVKTYIKHLSAHVK
jgi:hypothetical protein